MKKIHLTLILFTLIITLNSCSIALRLAYGIHKPKIVSSNKITRKAKQYHLKYFDHYSVTVNGFYIYTTLNNSFNGFLIFNSNGKLIVPRDTVFCSGEKGKFLYNFKDTSQSVVIDTIDISKFLVELRTLSGDSVTNWNSNSDYTIFLYWATFAGRLNKILTSNWSNKLYISDIKQYKVVFVCLDPREFWTGEKIRFEIEKQ